MTQDEIQRAALDRARRGQSIANYPAIYAGFGARGIPYSEIKPRENVFTFAAWKRLGRVVRKGEHGVRINTFIEFGPKVNDDGEVERLGGRKPCSTTVFHISQTEEL